MVAADFARLIRTTSGCHRIGTGNIPKLLGSRYAKQIESLAKQSIASTDPLFRAPFHYYLTPFALSSKLWQARIDTPASLTSPSSSVPGAFRLATLAHALNRTFRPAQVNTWLFGKSIHRIQGRLIEATGGPETSKRWRQGEMMFPVGTTQVLSPAASDVAKLLRELIAALQDSRRALPLTRCLYAALLICLIHPFVDGNGRLMRAVASAHNGSACRTGAVCRAIALFQQGRQRLWNFTLPLALQGNTNALWDHFDCCIQASSRLVAAVDEVARRYQAHWGLGRGDLDSPADALLVAAAVLSDRQYYRLLRSSSARVRQLAETNFRPLLIDDEKPRWVNSAAQHLVGDTASILISQI